MAQTTDRGVLFEMPLGLIEIALGERHYPGLIIPRADNLIGGAGAEGAFWLTMLVVQRTSFISEMSMVATGFLKGVDFFAGLGLSTVDVLVGSFDGF